MIRTVNLSYIVGITSAVLLFYSLVNLGILTIEDDLLKNVILLLTIGIISTVILWSIFKFAYLPRRRYLPARKFDSEIQRVILAEDETSQYKQILDEYRFILEREPLVSYKLSTLLDLIDKFEFKTKSNHNFSRLADNGYILLMKHYENLLKYHVPEFTQKIETENLARDLAILAIDISKTEILEKEPSDSPQRKGFVKIICRDDITPGKVKAGPRSLVSFLE